MNKGVDNLILTGNSTSGCVHATAVDAGGFQLNVSILEECVFDRFDLSNTAALFNLGTKYADIVSLEETYEYIASVRSGQRETAALAAVLSCESWVRRVHCHRAVASERRSDERHPRRWDAFGHSSVRLYPNRIGEIALARSRSSLETPVW